MLLDHLALRLRERGVRVGRLRGILQVTCAAAACSIYLNRNKMISHRMTCKGKGANFGRGFCDGFSAARGGVVVRAQVWAGIPRVGRRLHVSRSSPPCRFLYPEYVDIRRQMNMQHRGSLQRHRGRERPSVLGLTWRCYRECVFRFARCLSRRLKRR